MAITTPPRLTRAEAKERTRRRLIEAGRRVFLRAGYHAASLDQVAGEAGMTKGAVYSTFESKADLFMAIHEERVDERSARYRAFAQSAASSREMAAAGAREWLEVMRSDRDWSLLLIEFWVHAARHPELRRRFAERHRRQRDALAEALAASSRRAGDTLAIDPREAATAVMALGNGFNLERFSEPDTDDELYVRANEALRVWMTEEEDTS